MRHIDRSSIYIGKLRFDDQYRHQLSRKARNIITDQKIYTRSDLRQAITSGSFHPNKIFGLGPKLTREIWNWIGLPWGDEPPYFYKIRGFNAVDRENVIVALQLARREYDKFSRHRKFRDVPLLSKDQLSLLIKAIQHSSHTPEAQHGNSKKES